jgi:hypothetical protein
MEQKYMMGQKQAAKMTILAWIRKETVMENSAKTAPLHMDVPLYVKKMNMRAPQDLMNVIVWNKQRAHHVHWLTVNVAQLLQIALPFASLMKKNVPHLVPTTTVALSPRYVLCKNVIITVNYVKYIVQVFVMNIK